MIYLLLVLAVFATTGEARPAAHVSDWVKGEKPGSDHELEVTFAIGQTNKRWLEDMFWRVSDPLSQDYGSYLNFDEIALVVHGKEDAVAAIEDHLTQVGVDVTTAVRYTIGKDFAVVRLSVRAAEQLFSADFYWFTHGEAKIVKSIDHTLPLPLLDHVDFVSGISEFPRPNTALPRHHVQQGRLGVNPKSIDSAYNISGYSSDNVNNSQAIASFLKQYYSPDDLRDFQKANHLTLKPIAKVVGKNNPELPGVEADLDVQYISAIGRNVDTWFVSTSTYSNGRQEDFLSWLVDQVNTTSSPWVHSISYGDRETSIAQDYIDRINVELQKFGTSGRTVLFASGDSGVDCRGSIVSSKKFHPSWPASSPYATSVGGTTNINTAWELGGGGFSDKQLMPAYQQEAVKNYLASKRAPAEKYFNASGRAYPDVSAFAVNFEIYYLEMQTGVDGTSCATPTFAGIVSLLNNVRLNIGKPTVGFMNPWLYGQLKGKGFIDVTKGTNSGESECPGFEAIAGWDPASGWGQPNFGLLKDLVTQ